MAAYNFTAPSAKETTDYDAQMKDLIGYDTNMFGTTDNDIYARGGPFANEYTAEQPSQLKTDWISSQYNTDNPYTADQAQIDISKYDSIGANNPMSADYNPTTNNTSMFGDMSGAEMGKLATDVGQFGLGVANYFQSKPILKEQLKGLKMSNEIGREKIDSWKRHDSAMRAAGLRD